MEVTLASPASAVAASEAAEPMAAKAAADTRPAGEQPESVGINNRGLPATINISFVYKDS